MTFEEKLMSCECHAADNQSHQHFDAEVKPRKPHLSCSRQKSLSPISCVQARRQLQERYTFKYERRDDSQRAARTKEINGSRRRWSSAGKFQSCSRVDTLQQIVSTERRIKMLEIGNLYSLNNRSNLSFVERRKCEQRLQKIFEERKRAEALYEECSSNIRHLSHDVDVDNDECLKKEFSSQLRPATSVDDDKMSMKKLSSLLSSSSYHVSDLECHNNDDESGSNDAATISTACMVSEHHPSQQNLSEEEQKASGGAVEVDRMTTSSLKAIEEGSSTTVMAKEDEKSLINCPAESLSSFNQVAKVDSDKRSIDVSRDTLMSTKESNASAPVESEMTLNEQDSFLPTAVNPSFQIHRTSTFLSHKDLQNKSKEMRRRSLNMERESSSSMFNLVEDDSEEMLSEIVETIINFTDA